MTDDTPPPPPPTTTTRTTTIIKKWLDDTTDTLWEVRERILSAIQKLKKEIQR